MCLSISKSEAATKRLPKLQSYDKFKDIIVNSVHHQTRELLLKRKWYFSDTCTLLDKVSINQSTNDFWRPFYVVSK